MSPGDLALAADGAGFDDAVIHLSSLDDPTACSRDDGRWIYPASMIKVPLAVATASAVEAGRLAWSDTVRIDALNLTPNDAPSPFEAGYAATIDELVTFMLQRSDNVATNQLYDVLGRERATAELRALGYEQTAFRRKLSGADPLIDDPAASGRNTFPASEAARLFRELALDAVPGAEKLRKILAASWWNGKLSRGLVPGDAFAHKTGDTSQVSHDGGILTLAGSRWVLVVYTELPSTTETEERFGAFMRALRPRLNGAKERRANVRTAPLNLNALQETE